MASLPSPSATFTTVSISLFTEDYIAEINVVFATLRAKHDNRFSSLSGYRYPLQHTNSYTKSILVFFLTRDELC